MTSEESARKIVKETGVNTINGHFLQDGKYFKSKKTKTKPQLTRAYKRQRLGFAEKHSKWLQKWRNVIFTGVKKFNLDGPNRWEYYYHDLQREEKLQVANKLMMQVRSCGSCALASSIMRRRKLFLFREKWILKSSSIWLANKYKYVQCIYCGGKFCTLKRWYRGPRYTVGKEAILGEKHRCFTVASKVNWPEYNRKLSGYARKKTLWRWTAISEYK